jgi:hypothetical protein
MTTPDLTLYHGFFGSPRYVAEQLYALPRSAVSGVYYALLLESRGQSDVRVFIRAEPDDDVGEVRDWSGEQLGDLPERLLSACWSRTTSDWSTVLEVIASFGPYAVQAGIPCPPSARGAFGHQLRRHEQQEEIRAFVLA